MEQQTGLIEEEWDLNDDAGSRVMERRNCECLYWRRNDFGEMEDHNNF